MEPRELAAQLRCPAGSAAPKVARQMNEANGNLNRKCIDMLRLQAGDSVLEIGPGNGAFAPDIVAAADAVSYTGIDLSEDMVREAQRHNQDLVSARRARFRQGSSDQLPFPDATFDKILTVHTLYFWEQPADHIDEIRRVLRPCGLFCLGFADREFMRNLPFATFGFKLYGAADAESMLTACRFRIVDRAMFREHGRSNTGEIVDKRIHVFLCTA
ncbi:MAG TPA: class I SAM-dependent methyltransferase [Noviherbaspirillum sp.]